SALTRWPAVRRNMARARRRWPMSATSRSTAKPKLRFSSACARWDTSSKRMPHIQTNGVELHYLQMGEGPDLVMLHGISGNLAVWPLRMVPLLQQHFRVTTYDLRGHGNSSMPPSGYTTRDMAHDLGGLLDELEIEQADIVGHSFGADVAMHFTLLQP